MLLVIDVAATTLWYDRTVKGPLYARFGIPEYWLVDLNRAGIEVRRELADGGYRSVRVYHRGERVRLQTLPGIEIAVDEILG